MQDKIEKKHPGRVAKRRKEFLKNEESLRDILDKMKPNNIHVMGISAEESEQGIENLFEEIKTESFPNLLKEKDTQVQEAQRVPNKLDPKRFMSRHIIIKMTRLKDKERILKATRE